jgi:hypothetical protein
MNQKEFEELIFLWREYGTEKDKYLNKDAQQLKREILYFVDCLPTLPTALSNIPPVANYLFQFPTKKSKEE